MQISRMVWVSAHSDYIGVIRDVPLPRRNDKVKHRTTFVLGTLLSQDVLPFPTIQAKDILLESAAGPTQHEHHVTIHRGAQVGQRTAPGHVGVHRIVQQGLLHAHMTPYLPFTRAARPMSAWNEFGPSESFRII